MTVDVAHENIFIQIHPYRRMASDAEIAISGSGKLEDGAMKRIENLAHLSVGMLGNGPLFIMFRVTFTACSSGRKSIFLEKIGVRSILSCKHGVCEKNK